MLEEKKLIPELQELLERSRSQRKRAKGSSKTSARLVDDRAAAFVYLPESTQAAIVKLVWDYARMPASVAVRGLRRQIEAKEMEIQSLRQAPEALQERVDELDKTLSERGREIMQLRVLNETQLEELMTLRQARQKERERDEARRTRQRKQDRVQAQQAITAHSLEDRYEDLLKAAEFYKEAVSGEKAKTLDYKRVVRQIADIRKKLTTIERAITICKPTNRVL
jgi:chromosome segregation ATPase